MRTTRDAFDDPPHLTRNGDVETERAQDYSPRSRSRSSIPGVPSKAITTSAGPLLIWNGSRPRSGRYTRLVAGDMAFQHWTAAARGTRFKDGADAFLIKNGRVDVQKIHYTLEMTRTTTDLPSLRRELHRLPLTTPP